MIGRIYLERGVPVTVVARWRSGNPLAPSPEAVVLWLKSPRGAPRNVLVSRASGELVVRPFRGLRKTTQHRPDDEVRPVPVPPEMVAILRWHIETFGVAPDGRLFRQPNGGVVGSSTYGQVWRAARELALTPDQVASPLAGRPYDLRHAASLKRMNSTSSG